VSGTPPRGRPFGPAVADRAWVAFFALQPSAPAVERLWDVLDSDEKTRAGMNGSGPPSGGNWVAWAYLRLVIGQLTLQSPQSLRFVRDPNGKPCVAAHSLWAPYFSLSHSRALGMVGVCFESAIGVDVECLRPLTHWGQLGRGWLEPGGRLAKAARERDLAAFYGTWTMLEAQAKRHGVPILQWLREPAGSDASPDVTLSLVPRAGYVAAVSLTFPRPLLTVSWLDGGGLPEAVKPGWRVRDPVNASAAPQKRPVT
jgi:phosphopantetheinyl transferase